MDKETLKQVHEILKIEWTHSQKEADRMQSYPMEKSIVAWNVGRADGIGRAMMIIEDLERL